MTYKWCAVPACTNTSIKTPDKLFISVPKKLRLRKKWLQLACRNPSEIVPNSNVFFCEDHFDMHKDMSNYYQYKMGFSQRIIMVEGALPTKFDCQQEYRKKMYDINTPRPFYIQLEETQHIPDCEENQATKEQEVLTSDVNMATESQPKQNEITSTELIESCTSRSEIPEGKIVIARVFRHLRQEYEDLKNSNQNGGDLGLADILKRTAAVTGVSEDTVITILEEEKTSEKCCESTPAKRLKLDSEIREESQDTYELKLEVDVEDDDDSYRRLTQRITQRTLTLASVQPTPKPSAPAPLDTTSVADVKTEPVDTGYPDDPEYPHINIGMKDELPLGSPLETPLHVKRRRTLAQDRDHIEHPEYEQPSTSTAHILSVPPAAAHVECAMTTPPRAAQITQTCRRPLGDNEICGLLNYGSEEEEGSNPDSDEECEAQISIPHGVRALLETAEDTPQEAEAAGRIEIVESAQIGVGLMRGPTSLFDFEWHSFPASPISPHLRREKFVGRCGPMIGPISSPYEAFLLIWDRPIMEYIALQTNLYAQEYAEQLFGRGEIGPSSRITLWRDTNVDELYVYFALLMAMGIVVKSKLEEYWSTDRNIFSTPGYSTNMSLKRFQLLSKCLHFNINRNISSNTLTCSQAKIYKVAPIVDHLNVKFSRLYGLGQNIALDESLTQWNGWLDIKQFIPKKAAAVGIKTYEVCDSRTGYLWRFECHVGGQIEAQQEVISGSIPNLVLRLLRGLENRGHTVWMDNYYNSPALARVLKSIGYDCVGTLRTNRQFVPAQITDLKKADMTMGQVCGCTSGDVDLMVWRDQNRVALLSTYHGISVSENKPIAIKDYNVCMGGVDKKDQMLSAYPLERKRTQVWYKKFFRRLLNVSVLNAYILYKHTHDISHRQFRKDLVTEILQKHLQSRPDIAIATVRGVPKFSAEIISHLPAELPVLPGDKTGKQRRQCVVCKTKRTHYVCRACNVALCVNFADTSSCYIRYHT